MHKVTHGCPRSRPSAFSLFYLFLYSELSRYNRQAKITDSTMDAGTFVGTTESMRLRVHNSPNPHIPESTSLFPSQHGPESTCLKSTLSPSPTCLGVPHPTSQSPPPRTTLRGYLKTQKQSRDSWGEQGWCSGESTRLPPLWPGFNSWTRRHMWVEFVVGSRPCSEHFSPGSLIFLPLQKSTLLNSNLTWKQWIKSHFLEMPLQIH